MQLKPIDQQVVVVMEASGGIGREAALQFAKKDAKLVVAARSEDGLSTLIREIAQLGETASLVGADATLLDQVKAAVDKAIQLYRRLHTWVHTATVNIYATFEQTIAEEMDALLNQIGFRLQQTKEPKAKTELDNLFEPITDDRVKGDFSGQARPSISTWLDLYPVMRGDRSPRKHCTSRSVESNAARRKTFIRQTSEAADR